MNLTSQLLHRIADPSLSQSERAQLRCQLAKQLEEVGNYDAAREAMGDLWCGVGHLPILDDLNQKAAAEVLMRAGVLTGWIGSVKQIEGAQETAKDLINKSIRSFEALQEPEKIAEAQMELGHCYWREGALDEARVWLNEALSRLPDQAGEVKAVTLLRLAIVERGAKRFNEALRIHLGAASLFERSANHLLQGKFHNGFGFLLRNLDDIDQALIEYTAASYHFEQAGHTRYQACVENNLGFLFGTIKRFAEAHEHLDRAQALFTKLRDKVHIAQVDDARAKVLLEEGRIAEAEKIAHCAVRTLETGGQQSLYAEALITHGIALARLNRFHQARHTLQAALVVAQNAGDSESAGQAALTIIEELGERLPADDLGQIYQYALDSLSISKQLATKDRLLSCGQRVMFFAGLLNAPPTWEGFALKDWLRQIEGRVIERALKDSGGLVTHAAHLLGLHHTTLVNKINKCHRHLLATRSPIIQRPHSLMFIDENAVETPPVRILHVEDRADIADAVKEVLEDEGWIVETCDKGFDALKLLESEAHFNVLIFDNQLPDVNGVELIRLARRMTHRQHTPVIMLSGSEIETEARRAGANVFLRKPGDMRAIAETIARLLARKPKHKGQ